MYKWTGIIVLIMLTGCSQRIITYLNPKANFQTFETYRLVSPKLNNKASDATAGVYTMVKENITKEMTKRDYLPSSVSPDLTLRYELSSSTRVETSTSQSFYYPAFQVNTRTIHEAVLLFELFDQNNKLVWQGSYDLNQERKEKRVRKVIQNAVARIFTTYPYKALQKSPDISLQEFKKQQK